jgi:NADPH2:quinone reductase
MLAVQAIKAGGPEVLEIVEKPTPGPAPGEIRVRHAAIGLNFIDTYQRSGLYKIPYPAVLGSEAAGTVEAIGDGVTRFKVGDRAAYGNGPLGAYAEAHCVQAARAVHVPDSLSLEIAAAVMLKGMTAEFLIQRCFPVQAGQTILIHAAAGGVGQILVQWAKALGATVIATAGGPDKLALAQSLGAAHLIDYRTEDVAQKVREITDGKGVPVVYDSVGASTFEGSLASLAVRGTLVSFGNASGPVPPFAPLRLAAAGSVYMTRPTMGHYVATTEELDASASDLFAMITSGKIRISIGQTFPLAEARAAHEALEGRATTGSTLLIP